MPDRTPPAEDPKALKKLPRDELNEVAAEAGVENAEDLANKDEVIAALPNPALAPVPDPPEGEVEYEVIGPQRVHDTLPGGKFTADLTPESEALLIESGHIKRTNPED